MRALAVSLIEPLPNLAALHEARQLGHRQARIPIVRTLHDNCQPLALGEVSAVVDVLVHPGSVNVKGEQAARSQRRRHPAKRGQHVLRLQQVVQAVVEAGNEVRRLPHEERTHVLLAEVRLQPQLESLGLGLAQHGGRAIHAVGAQPPLGVRQGECPSAAGEVERGLAPPAEPRQQVAQVGDHAQAEVYLPGVVVNLGVAIVDHKITQAPARLDHAQDEPIDDPDNRREQRGYQADDEERDDEVGDQGAPEAQLHDHPDPGNSVLL